MMLNLKLQVLTPNRGSINIGPGDFIRSDGELQSDYLRGTDTKSDKVNNTMDYLNMLKNQKQ